MVNAEDTKLLNEAWRAYLAAVANVFIFAIGNADELKMVELRAIRRDARVALIAAGGVP
jgi:hypothetical protein